MTSVATALPLLGLRVTAGPVELRGITDDLIVPLAELAGAGIHDPDFMPFYTPWSLTPAAEMPRSMAQFHWAQRTGFSVAKWGADFAVFYDGELVGSQGIGAHDYLITRTRGDGVLAEPRQTFSASGAMRTMRPSQTWSTPTRRPPRSAPPKHHSV